MLTDNVKITVPANEITDQIPADVYQIQVSDITEVDGTDYNTKEPKKQLKFYGIIVDGDEVGKKISFFTSHSWFNGGKNSKPSKLFNLVKTVYSYYKKDVKVADLPLISVEEVNGLVGKQLRVTTEVNEKGWPKVTSFTPIKKHIEYEGEVSDFEKEMDENVNLDDIKI